MSTLGSRGEDVAVVHLEELGWQILDRNWRCRDGELDVVALEPGPPTCVVFVEVKCRAGTGYGDPLEAITDQKLRRLRRLAACWLHERALQSGLPRPAGVRLDAIGITWRRGQAYELRHERAIS